MAGITLEQAQARLQEYLDAETAVLAGQAWALGGQQLTRANLADIQAGIKVWDERCKALAAAPAVGGRGRSVTVAPRW